MAELNQDAGELEQDVGGIIEQEYGEQPEQPSEYAISDNDFELMLGGVATGGTATNGRYAVQDSFIKGTPYDADQIESTKATGNSKAIAEQSANEKLTAKLNAVTEQLRTNIISKPEDVDAHIQNAQLVNEETNKAMNSSTKLEQEAVNGMAPGGDNEVLARKSLELAVANDMASWYDGQGTAETVLDYASSFLLGFGTQAADISDIDDAIKSNPALAEIAADDLEGQIQAWHMLPYSRRLALYPELKKSIIKSTETLGITDGNMVKAKDFLIKFLDVQGNQQLETDFVTDIAFAGLDLAGFKALRALPKGAQLGAKAIMRDATVDAVKKSQPVRVAAEAGDVESAAAHTTAAMTNSDTAANIGTTREGAAMSAHPMHFTDDWFGDVVNDPNIPKAVQDRMNQAYAQASGFTRKLTDESELMQLGVLNASERNKVIDNFDDIFNTVREDYLTEGAQLSDARIISQDADGFTYQFTKTHPDYSEEVFTETYKFKRNDITGDYLATADDKAAQSQARYIFDPKTWSVSNKADGSSDFGIEVDRAIQAEVLTSASTRNMAELLRWATDPIKGITNRKSAKRVEDVLLAGDEYINPETMVEGRVFTPTELMSGVTIPNKTIDGRAIGGYTVKLTDPDEIESYYRMRMVADTGFKIEQDILRKELEQAGFKNVNLKGQMFQQEVDGAMVNVKNKAKTIAKPYESVEAARLATKDSIGHGVWNNVKNEVEDLTEAYVDEVYESGDILVKAKNDWNVSGNGDFDTTTEVVNWMRVKASDVTDLPVEIVKRRPGYITKINKANYAVSMKIPMIARGRSVSRTQASRLFNSKMDAEKFREQQIVKFMNKNGAPREDAEKFFPPVENNINKPLVDRIDDVATNTNGLYYGNRSKDRLIFGMSGQDVERVPAFEAMSRYASHIGKMVSENEVRWAREQRWINTVRAAFPEIKVNGFNNTAIPANTPRGKALEQMRRTINEWNAMPTQEETLFQTVLQKTHDLALYGARALPGYADKESVKSLLWLQHTNPISAMKAATLHMLLGVMSPVQLLVQASAAIVPLTRRPELIPRALEGFTYHFLDNIRNDNALGKVYKMLKADKILSQEAIDGYNVYRTTGLSESAYVNADIAHMSETGLGITSSLLRNAETASLFVWRSGELINKRISFAAEYAAWRRTSGGRVTPNPDELEKLLSSANKNMLELNSANRAMWQGGVGTGTVRETFGLATQFLQVGAKMMSLIAKGEKRGGFSNAEKARIFGSQAVLFGAAGVPMGNYLSQLVVKMISGEDGQVEVDENIVKLVSQGTTGWLVKQMTGVDVDVSSRIGVGAQITQMVADWVTDESPIWLKMGGPAFSGTGSRTFQAFSEVSTMFQANRAGNVEMGLPEIKMGLSTFMQTIPSSGRSYLRYKMAHEYNTILDSRKNPVINKDFTDLEEAFIGMGFTIDQETGVRQAINQQYDIEESINEIVQTKINAYWRMLYVDKLDPERIKGYLYGLQLMDEIVDPILRDKARERFIERVFKNPETKEDKMLNWYYTNYAPENIRKNAVLDVNSPLGNSGAAMYQPFRYRIQDQEVFEQNLETNSGE